jgi:hypothetical protein
MDLTLCRQQTEAPIKTTRKNGLLNTTRRHIKLAAHGLCALSAALLLTAQSSQAACVDLINSDTGIITTGDGGRFDFMTQQPTGTGVIDPFLRLQRKGVEQGYNTSGVTPQAPFDDKAGIWTHDLRMSDLTLVTLDDNKQYYQFLLDINEAVGHQNEFLSLDRLQIYTSTVASQTTEVLNNADTVNQTVNLASSTLRYNLDAGGVNNTVLMDYSRNEGSGSGDMVAYIPASLFAGASADDVVYLYSQFGATVSGGVSYTSGSGFEEWWVLSSQPIPEPATIFSGLFLLAGLGWMERSRLKGLWARLAGKTA